DQVRVAAQVQRPALVAGDSLTHALPAFAVTVEVTMLELDARALRRLGDEADLPLALPLRVALQLPAGTDVPAHQDARGRLEGEHARPSALAPVHAAVG